MSLLDVEHVKVIAPLLLHPGVYVFLKQLECHQFPVEHSEGSDTNGNERML